MSDRLDIEKLAPLHRHPVAVSVADPDRADCPLVLANAAFEQLSGYAQDEVLGRNCRFLQCPETDPGAVGKLRAAVAARRSCAALLLNRRRDGAVFANYLCLDPIQFDCGKTWLIGCQFAFARPALAPSADRAETGRRARGIVLADVVRDSIEARRNVVLTLTRIYLRRYAARIVA